MPESLQTITEQLHEARRRIDLIRTVTSELNKILRLPEKLNNILKILYEQFGIQYSMILLPDASGEKLVVRSSYGYTDKKLDAEIAFGVGVAGLAARNKKPINITGIRRKKQYLRFASMQPDATETPLPGIANPESQIAIPLIANDELVAVLMAESENYSVFTKEDELFLITLAQPIAVSIQNSLLFDTMEATIAKRTAELKQLNETKDRLFSVISHDLRGPISSFHALSKLIPHYTKLAQPEKLETLTQRIDQSVQRLNGLLENLLNWAMTQTKEVRRVVQPIDANQLLDDVIEIYQENLTSKELKLYKNYSGCFTIAGDYNMLSAVFRNLLSNAIKYTPRQGEIRVNIYREASNVIVEIQDTGVGIEPEKLATILEPAGNKSTQGTEQERGTGLGLLIAKEFVELNHGTINIRSSAGGTTVAVSLPCSVY